MNHNMRRARIAMVLGALALALAVALTLWDLSGDDGPTTPVPITGEVDSP